MNRPLVEVFAPSLGCKVKLGRRVPVAQGPQFRLENYLGATLPSPPATLDYTQGVSTSAALANIDGNDTVGDCVIAWLLHQLAVWTGNAGGVAFNATRTQAIAMYSAITGYNPSDPSTDQGTDPAVAMNWIIANGYPNGDKPLGWVRVTPALLRQAIWLFEGNGFGIGLPDAYVQNMPSSNGFVWDAAGVSNPNNGHMFLGAGYDASRILIDTWGLLGWFTDAAVAAYATAVSGGEIDILLSADMIAAAAAKAPSGFDWQALVADFDSMGGAVPAPAPAPPPTPAPPGTPVTLALAQGWITSGLSSSSPLLTRQQAVDAANAGLAAMWPAAS